MESCKLSPLYRSAAMYVTEQPDFLNAVISGEYEGTPEQLLDLVQKIESDLGRIRSQELRRGPRTMDIDILLFGNKKIENSELSIPHSLMRERAFVLKPLLDLDMDLHDPVSGIKFSEILSEIDVQEIWPQAIDNENE